MSATSARLTLRVIGRTAYTSTPVPGRVEVPIQGPAVKCAVLLERGFELSDFDFLHEIKIVEFRFAHQRPLRDLIRILVAIGFVCDDGALFFDRTDECEDWQSICLTRVAALADGHETYDPSQNLEAIELHYLLATLPASLLPDFISVVANVANALGETPRFDGTEVTLEGLSQILEGFVHELRTEIGEPGSHGIRIEIEMTYPRKH